MTKYTIEIADAEGEGDPVDFTFYYPEEGATEETEAQLYMRFLAYFIESGNLKQYARIWLKGVTSLDRVEEVNAESERQSAAT